MALDLDRLYNANVAALSLRNSSSPPGNLALAASESPRCVATARTKPVVGGALATGCRRGGARPGATVCGRRQRSASLCNQFRPASREGEHVGIFDVVTAADWRRSWADLRLDCQPTDASRGARGVSTRCAPTIRRGVSTNASASRPSMSTGTGPCPVMPPGNRRRPAAARQSRRHAGHRQITCAARTRRNPCCVVRCGTQIGATNPNQHRRVSSQYYSIFFVSV